MAVGSGPRISCLNSGMYFQKFKDNCNPVYDETLEYDGSLNETRIRTLEVLVVSKKSFARNPVLGMVRHVTFVGY